MRIVLLIPQLEIGGAEKQFVSLSRQLIYMGHNIIIVCIGSKPSNASARHLIADLPIVFLGKRSRDLLSIISDSKKIIKDFNPGVIHGFLDLGNLIAAFIGRIQDISTVWGVRDSGLYRNEGFRWLLLKVALTLVSRWPNLIIINSESAKKNYILKHKYPDNKIRVIRNSIDQKLYVRDYLSANKLKEKLSIDKNALVVGVVGRADPVKRIELAIQATMNKRDMFLVLIGDYNNPYGQELLKLVGENRNIAYLDVQQNVAEFYNSVDVLLALSSSEGFSNVLIEAMLCETICVSSVAGDALALLDDFYVIKENQMNIVDVYQKLTSVRVMSNEQKRVVQQMNRARAMALCAENFPWERYVSAITAQAK